MTDQFSKKSPDFHAQDEVGTLVTEILPATLGVKILSPDLLKPDEWECAFNILQRSPISNSAAGALWIMLLRKAIIGLATYIRRSYPMMITTDPVTMWHTRMCAWHDVHDYTNWHTALVSWLANCPVADKSKLIELGELMLTDVSVPLTKLRQEVNPWGAANTQIVESIRGVLARTCLAHES